METYRQRYNRLKMQVARYEAYKCKRHERQRLAAVRSLQRLTEYFMDYGISPD